MVSQAFSQKEKARDLHSWNRLALGKKGEELIMKQYQPQQRRSKRRSGYAALWLLGGIPILVLLIVMALLPAQAPAQAQSSTSEWEVWFAVVSDPQFDWYEVDEATEQ